MKTELLFSSPFPARGFIRGCLEKNQTGEVVLKTREGVFPVKLEGEMVTLGEELVFRVLREEPGRLVLTPYRLETLSEALPFFKPLFAGEEETGIKLLLAAIQENLPLNRETLAGLKKGLMTAERQWGVEIHPRVLAFLQARGIPLTPRSLLWALYTLFPAVQKIMWQKAGTGKKLLPEPVVQQGGGLAEAAWRREEGEAVTESEVLGEVLQEAVAFLQHQAEHEPALPHFIFYLFPALQREARWVGRKFPAPQSSDAEADAQMEPVDFGFCLEYQSTLFGHLQITGIGNQQGISLTVEAEEKVIAQSLLSGLGPYLAQKGWPVRSIAFQMYQGKKAEASSPVSYPLRIDGWL